MRKCCQKYTGKRGEQSMEHITSRQNALMTHIRKLSASRAYRRASGEYLCDGVKLLPRFPPACAPCGCPPM